MSERVRDGVGAGERGKSWPCALNKLRVEIAADLGGVLMAMTKLQSGER